MLLLCCCLRTNFPSLPLLALHLLLRPTISRHINICWLHGVLPPLRHKHPVAPLEVLGQELNTALNMVRVPQIQAPTFPAASRLLRNVAGSGFCHPNSIGPQAKLVPGCPCLGGAEMGAGSSEKLGLLLLLALGKPVITQGIATEVTSLGAARSDKLLE